MSLNATVLTRRMFVKASALAGAIAVTAGARVSLAAGAASSAADSAASATPTPETIDWRTTDVNALVAGGANIALAKTYSIYRMEGDSIDSAIECDVYYDLDADKIVDIEFEEVLLPMAAGGAEGWGVLDDETAAKLGDAVLDLDGVKAPKSFELGGITWTGEVADNTVTYTADINGATTAFNDYVDTPEGGAWYHECYTDGADLLDADGKVAAHVEIGTKASTNHGVDFWASPITFPGNIQLIKNYLYDHGTDFAYAPDGGDIKQDDAGVWEVLDTVTGATLAGTPNYLNLAKEAVEAIKAGDYETVEEGTAPKAASSAADKKAASK